MKNLSNIHQIAAYIEATFTSITQKANVVCLSIQTFSLPFLVY